MNTQTTIAGITFKNPVMTASGTFGSGMEYGEFVDLNRLGAVVTKGVANVPWPGNPTPRLRGGRDRNLPARADGALPGKSFAFCLYIPVLY